MDMRPNILVIMVDQMMHDVIASFGKHPVITPSLDKLTEKGIVFENCYCNSPLCSPSRAAFFSGRHIRNNKVYDNASEFSAQIPTLMHHLKLCGYETTGAGKMHFIGPDQLHGFESRLTTDIFPSDFGFLPDWSRDVSMSSVNANTVKSAAACRWNKYSLYDEEVLFRSLEKIRYYGMNKQEKPFFMCSSFTNPHPPFKVLGEYLDFYNKTEIPLPDSQAGDFDRLHTYDKDMLVFAGLNNETLSDDEIIKARKVYYAMVTYTDYLIGQLLHELERSGLQDSTAVVFTSDHGEMLGEHGLWFKRTYYEDSVRVPLIMYWPGVSNGGRKITEVVSLVDLCATLMKIGGINDYETWAGRIDGDSFDRVIAGKEDGWKDEALFEYYDAGTMHPMAGIRKGRYKFVYIHNSPPLLFDLEDDPTETVNLAGKEAYKEICSNLQSRVIDNWNPGQLEDMLKASQRERSLIQKAMRTGKRVSWDYQPVVDASERYVR